MLGDIGCLAYAQVQVHLRLFAISLSLRCWSSRVHCNCAFFETEMLQKRHFVLHSMAIVLRWNVSNSPGSLATSSVWFFAGTNESNSGIAMAAFVSFLCLCVSSGSST